MRRRQFYPLVKRTADIIAASLGLVVLSPVIAVTAAAVAADLGRPVVFRQERPGRDAKIFTIYKFRSMRDANLQAGLVEDGDRLTRFGRLLRSTSLDELPSLWNVVRGDMSVVGPRPLLVEYLDLYTPEQTRRHEVRPGITGLAQTNGRNGLAWEHKFDLDVKYIDTYGLMVDLRILWATLKSVVAREGISYKGHETMHKYSLAADV